MLEAVEHSQLAIAKISAMFPTVPESHIKDLASMNFLSPNTFCNSNHRYHNREAVVISALQVQKHPLATPGPYGTFTPPPMRHFIPTATALMALQSTKTSVNTTGMADVSATDFTSGTATTAITSCHERESTLLGQQLKQCRQGQALMRIQVLKVVTAQDQLGQTPGFIKDHVKACS